jgi:phytoene dehydrogenase-like protein
VSDVDVAVVGAGHNALVAAAYLAQAGRRVAVFERADRVGGAVTTEERISGYQFDLGGSAHILIRSTPVVEELGLERHGLEYLELDPLFFAPFEDGDHVMLYRSVSRTVAALEARFPGEGEAYARFLDDWRPFARSVRDAFLATPGPLQLGRTMGLRSGLARDFRRLLPILMRPYGSVVDAYFREEKLKAPLVWMAAQSGPPPGEALTAPFLLWHPLYHEDGIARPRGGSGMLTAALARAIESHGGTVKVSTPVEAIVVEGGRAAGVRVAGETVTAEAVLSGAHALETFGRLLPEEHRPAAARHMRPGNGFGAVVRLALSEPVRYTVGPEPDARVALQLLCRDRHQIEAAYGDYLRGDPSRDPPIVAMTFSAVDPGLAPPGGEVLWLWAQYFPYELAGGRSWDEIGPAVAASILDTFERYAPGTREKVVGSLFQHPLWLERELGLVRGNVMHLEMSLDQMFGLRPFLGASGYRAPLRGLYLTGASTHPGGGIMGASGRNAARVLLGDLERRRWWRGLASARSGA